MKIENTDKSQQDAPEKGSKISKIVICILISTSILTLGVFGLWLRQKKSTTSSFLPTITPLPVIKLEDLNPGQWKTYSSQPLGLSFIYPPAWPEPVFYKQSTKSQIVFTDGKEISGGIDKLEMTRGVYYDQDLQGELTFEEFVNKRSLPSEAGRKDFRLANWPGISFTYHSHGVGYYITEILLAKSKSATDILTIVYRHDIGESKTGDPKPIILNRILSSFRFLNDEQNFEINDWEIFTSSNLGLEVKYPPEFSVEQDAGFLRIFSPPIPCVVYETSGAKKPIGANEVNLKFFLHSGESYEKIWNRVFGFEFDTNFDGKKEIGGNEAYYFYQGPEMTFGRQAILVKLSPTTALEIDVYIPVSIQNCETPLNQYPEVADKILDALHFPKEFKF